MFYMYVTIIIFFYIIPNKILEAYTVMKSALLIKTNTGIIETTIINNMIIINTY